MKLLYVILPEAEARALLDVLIGAGMRCTRFDSHGGFLRARNSTLLLGVEDARLADVLNLIRTHTRQPGSPRALQRLRGQQREGGTAQPADASAGHATVFVQDVERYERF